MDVVCLFHKIPGYKREVSSTAGKFLDYIASQGTLEDKARAFAKKAKVDGNWKETKTLITHYLAGDKVEIMDEYNLCPEGR